LSSKINFSGNGVAKKPKSKNAYAAVLLFYEGSLIIITAKKLRYNHNAICLYYNNPYCYLELECC
jgi:hypothetical protein